MTLTGAAWSVWSQFEAAEPTISASTPATAADALQQELLKTNLGKPGDPRLGAIFQAIDARYFAGAVPPMPVLWEPGLARVGALAARTFTLEGMFGHIGKRSVILLNPALAGDRRALDRALCHEMVHAYLASTGAQSTDHGVAFQTVLHRLSQEGAFEGIPATDAERAHLHAWLDAESARLDVERRDMDRIGEDIERERVEIEHAFADFNARLGVAGGPSGSGDAAAALSARRDAYNQRAIEANARTAGDRADLKHFNDEVARYNLMLVYPDGIDETAVATPKVVSRNGG